MTKINRDFPLAPTPELDKGKKREYPFESKKGYKAVVVEDEKDGVTTAKIKVKRTFGGFISGKPKGKSIQIPAYNVPQIEKYENPERPKTSSSGNKDFPRKTKK